MSWNEKMTEFSSILKKWPKYLSKKKTTADKYISVIFTSEKEKKTSQRLHKGAPSLEAAYYICTGVSVAFPHLKVVGKSVF